MYKTFLQFLFLAGILLLFPLVGVAVCQTSSTSGCGGGGWGFYEVIDCPASDSSSPSQWTSCGSSQVFVQNWCYMSCSTPGNDWDQWYSGYCQESAACATPTCVSYQGQSCNINACGTAGGTYNCDGTCSGSTPATPHTVGAACNRNVCGGTGTITDACTGACSASELTVPANYGQSCTNSNACFSGTAGTYQCDGTCSGSAPQSLPAGYGNQCNFNNIGQSGGTINCSGTCSGSAPSDATISSFVAAPSGNVANETNVTYTVTASRDINDPASVYYMRIYETGVTAYRSSCGTGTTCSYTTNGTSTSKSFVAKIETWSGSTVAATSSTVSTIWGASDSTAPTGSISASPSSATSGSTFTITMSGSDSGSGVAWLLWNDVYSGGAQWYDCVGAASCSNSWAISFAVPGSYTFAGTIYDKAGNVLGVTSNTVTVKATTQLPDADFSFTPSSTTQGKSTQVAGMLKDSAGNGIGDKTVKLQYPSTDGNYYDVSGASGTTATTGTVGSVSFSWTPTSAFFGTVSYRLRFEGDTAYAASSSGSKNLTISEPTLAFPTGTWQRLWYSDPKAYSFSGASYRGEDTISDINKDWVKGELCASSVCGGTADSRKNTIGFKASRTLTGLTPGAYTITVGADDGVKLFVDRSGNLLLPRAWGGCNSSGCSYDDNINTVRVELGTTATVEIHYRENDTDAQISFAYSLGVRTESSPSCTEGQPNNTYIGCRFTTPVPTDPPCDFYAEGGICYYGSSTICGIATCSETRNACSYNSICTLQSGQSCTSLGCVEGTPPGVTINTTSGLWYKENSLLDVDATDNVALQSIKYQIDSYTADQAGTAVTSNGSSALAVSGTSMTTNWKISTTDWNNLSQGTHTLYVKAIDTSSNCRGCDGSRSFTIKKDTVSPSITVGEIKRTHSGLLGSKTLLATPETLGTDSLGRQWLRDGQYEIIISVDDKNPNGTNGSGVDTGYRTVVIKSLVDGREYPPSLVDFNKFSIWVGDKDSSLNDCVDEKEGKCRILITVRDKVGNYITIPPLFLNVDYTAPRAE